MGVLAPNGIGKEAFWEACRNGTSGAALITKFDASPMPSQMACEVDGFEPSAFGLTDYESTSLDRHVQFALAAAAQALEDGGLDPARVDGERAGVFVGSTNSAPTTFEGVWEDVTRKG